MGKNVRFKDWKAKKFQDPLFQEEAKKYELAYRIAQLRVKRGLTQSELAEIVGTKQSSIARFESGDNQPRVSFLRRVVKALGGSLDIKIIDNEEAAVNEEVKDKLNNEEDTKIIVTPAVVESDRNTYKDFWINSHIVRDDRRVIIQ